MVENRLEPRISRYHVPPLSSQYTTFEFRLGEISLRKPQRFPSEPEEYPECTLEVINDLIPPNSSSPLFHRLVVTFSIRLS